MKIAIKMKRQSGLFLLLFIPSMVLLIIHLLIPFILIVNHRSYIKQQYDADKISNQKNNILSLSLSNENKWCNTMRELEQQLDNIEIILQSLGQITAINNNQRFQYSFKGYQSINPQYRITLFSNWYSPDYDNKAEFSSQLKVLNNLYKKKEPLMAASVASLGSLFITNIITHVTNNNQSIFYNLETPNSSLESLSYYQIFPQLSFKDQQQVIKFFDKFDQKSQHLSMCKLIGLESPSKTTLTLCLRLNYQSLAKKQEISLYNNEVSFGKYSASYYQLDVLAQFNHTLLSLQTIDPIQAIKDPFDRQYLQGFSEGDNQHSILWSEIQKSFIYLNVQNNEENQAQFATVGKYSSFQSEESFSIELNLNILIIATVVIFILFIIIVSYILIKLLETIESELYELTKCCSFVLQGDIHLEIPDFVGTKCIADVYEHAKTINTLYKYSSEAYFVGHFSEKLLKYNSVLEFMKKLNYDPGYVLQNLGECYNWIEDWDKAIDSLKESVATILDQINQEYGSIDKMVIAKRNKKVPNGYKWLQNILLRRLFKLNFNLMRALQFNGLHVKDPNSLISPEELKRKSQIWMEQSTYYIGLQKKAFYPDLGGYAQSIIAHINEAKQKANLKRTSEAIELFERSRRILKMYQKQYTQTTKKLKLKGSKFKLFHMRHRLTGQSRLLPQLLKNLLNVFQGRALNAMYPKGQMQLQSVDILMNSFQSGSVIAVSLYLGVNQVRRIIKENKLDQEYFQSTQIFRQAMPFKTLHYGEINKQNEAQLYKCEVFDSLGLERQFMIVTDCSKSQLKEEQEEQLEYSLERLMHIYEKLIKPTDRLSLTKFATTTGTKTEFNLTLKESSEIVLRNELKSVYNDLSTEKNLEKSIFDVVMRSIWRVKNLKSDKVVLVFLKSVNFYANRQEQRKKKLTKRSKRKSSAGIQNLEKFLVEDECKHFGDLLVENLRDPQLRNCKVILYCSKEDSIEKTREFFNLKDINKRIWAQENQVNTRNVVVYLIESKHKVDIERILKIKAMIVADNNVFNL